MSGTDRKAEILRKLFNNMAVPGIAAPMRGVSYPPLVKAVCENGMIGSFPAANAKSTKELGEWLGGINHSLTAHWCSGDPEPRPVADYAVNLIVNKTINPRLEADLAMCAQHKVPIIITSLGMDQRIVDSVHDRGGLIFHDVTNIKHAKSAAKTGVDGIIAVPAGSGGHSGAMNGFALVRGILDLDNFDGITIMAGSITHGSQILAVQTLGADMVYAGTLFIATEESGASESHKNRIVTSEASDLIYTGAFTHNVPANLLRQSLQQAGVGVVQKSGGGWMVQHETAHRLAGLAGHFWRKAVKGAGLPAALAGKKMSWEDVLQSAGHGIQNMDKISTVAEVIERLADEYHTAQALAVQQATHGYFPLTPAYKPS